MDFAVTYQNEENSKKCLQDLCASDPRDDKKRIEVKRGGLLRESYYWAIEHPDFQDFLSNENRRLLWIKGDPGKGKTMLMCGIINELHKESDRRVCYFLCEAGTPTLESATHVLRGLIYLLVLQQPGLLPYLKTKYDERGENLFKDNNALVSMRSILEQMTQSASFMSTIFMIDAMDECVVGRSELLDFIIQSMAMGEVRLKWIISCRNRQDIEEVIDNSEENVRLHLELNQDLISRAVKLYITDRTNKLASVKKYNDETRLSIENYLTENANGTFLWVALIISKLSKVTRWNAKTAIKQFPPGLDALYLRMLGDLQRGPDPDRCRAILGTASIAFRPLKLKELGVIIPSLKNLAIEDTKEVIGYCGSFLVIQGDCLYFIHQSAKEFCDRAPGYNIIFPLGDGVTHYTIFLQSINVLMGTLRRNMYGLRHPGIFCYSVLVPIPDPLESIGYSCVYWCSHYCSTIRSERRNDDSQAEDGIIARFVRKTFLYWLECLSLLRSMPEGAEGLADVKEKIVSAVNIRKSDRVTN